MSDSDKKNNSGDRNSGYGNSGYGNSGDRNSGYGNSGDRNSGYGNSGNRNSGDGNSGYGNSGDGNSGYRNSGDRNSGDGNSGYGNSGYGNSGDRNSGYGNSGDGNSGGWNSGYRNSGYGNSCDRSSGIFCTIVPKLYLFNKPTDENWDNINHPSFSEFFLNKWIPESEMTETEKIEHENFFVAQGFLKTFTWKDAWQNYWKNSDEEERQKVLSLPNFDAEIFKQITGIDITVQKKDCSGHEIIVDGKRYSLTLIGD